MEYLSLSILCARGIWTVLVINNSENVLGTKYHIGIDQLRDVVLSFCMITRSNVCIILQYSAWSDVGK